MAVAVSSSEKRRHPPSFNRIPITTIILIVPGFEQVPVGHELEDDQLQVHGQQKAGSHAGNEEDIVQGKVVGLADGRGDHEGLVCVCVCVCVGGL